MDVDLCVAPIIKRDSWTYDRLLFDFKDLQFVVSASFTEVSALPASSASGSGSSRQGRP